jgi:RimJ/RimL family protein N-acetyltransferase
MLTRENAGMLALRHVADDEIVLRPPEPRDADLLFAACQDPEIPRWTTVPSPYTRDDALAWPDEARWFAEGDQALHLIVAGAGDDALLGSVGLPELDLAAARGEIGYWIAPWARGRGLAARAVALLRDAAVEQLGLRTLELVIHRDNAASTAVARRTGFAPTGESRTCGRRRVPGAGPDHLVYAWRAPSSPA